MQHPFLQRLRDIRQIGFSHLPFPGATHSRFSHSLGVMHLAGRAFDMAYRDWQFSSPKVREQLRQCVRLAALCHDVGHAPFSHCSEFAMPQVSTLGLEFMHVRQDRRATHEDYTIAILEKSGVGELINTHFGFTNRHVAALIASEIRVGDDFFRDGGFDHRRLLSQIVSSELDVDRLDYLVRDAYYSGARYGEVDVSWLMSNLSAYPKDGQVWLALHGRATYAFDDFLISRHHMFLMVYFHHKSVIFEELLKRYMCAEDCPYAIPADLDAYLHVDDVSLMQHLRESPNPWAQRVVRRDAFARALEVHGSPHEADLTRYVSRLDDEGIDHIAVTSTGKLSRYAQYGARRRRAPSLYVLDSLPGSQRKAKQLTEASKVFERYADARCIARIYVDPADLERAQAILNLGR